MSYGFVTDGKNVYKTNDVETFLADNPGFEVYEQPTAKGEERTTVGKAMALGAAQGFSAGLAEETEGAIRSGMAKAGLDVPRTRERGVDAPLMTTEDYIGEAREKYTKAAEDRPVTFYGADIAAGLPMGAVLPGAQLSKARSALKAKRALEALRAGGKGAVPLLAAGAVEGAARTEGDVGARLKGGAYGSALMGAVPPALKALASKPVGRAALGAGAGYLASEGAEAIVPGEHGDFTGFSVTVGTLLGLKPNAVLRIYSRIKGAGKSPATKKALDDFLSATPEGVELRRQAREGETAAQEVVEEIQGRLSKMLEYEDQVQAYAHTGMKPKYVEQAMVDDFVEAVSPGAPISRKTMKESPITGFEDTAFEGTAVATPKGKARQAARVDDFEDLVGESSVTRQAAAEARVGRGQLARKNLKNAYNNLHSMANEAEKLSSELIDAKLGIGKKLKNDVDKIRERFSQENLAGMEPSAAGKADAFIALDKLKRRVWSIAKSMERSSDSNSGYFAAEAWDTGTILQRNLEDPSVWGRDASNLQKDVNRAWHPYLTVRRPAPGEKGFEKRFLTHAGAEPSARIGQTRAEADPRKLETFVGDLGRYLDDPAETSFLKGIRTSTDLARALAKNYGGDPKLVGMAERMGEEQRAIEALLGPTKGKLEARRALTDIDKVGGPLKPSTVVRGMTALEDLASMPVAKTIGRGAGQLRKTVTDTPGQAGTLYDVASEMWGTRPISVAETEDQEDSERDPRLEAALRVDAFRKNTNNPKLKTY